MTVSEQNSLDNDAPMVHYIFVLNGGYMAATNCGQPDRDRETLRKFAEKYAVMALCNLPADYESRKRIITSAIVAALTSSEMQQVIQNATEEIEGPDYGGTVSEATLDDMRTAIRQAKGD